MQMTLSGQSNLVINHSLEDWNDQIPENWRIVANSVDLFKRNYKLIPYGVKCSEYKFRSKFPSKGSHGISYLGLAGNEIISCALRCPLDTKNIYELSFYVYNPPIYSDRKTNKFTVRFETEDGTSDPLLLQHHEEIDTFSHQWTKISRVIKGTGKEKRLQLGFFGNYYKDHPHNTAGLFYLFDQISITELCKKRDTLNIYFEKDQYTTKFDVIEEYFSNFTGIKNDIHIKIFGYASKEGDSAYNLNLSRKRCFEIQSKLSNYENIQVDSVIAWGEEKQFSNTQKENRLVEILVEYQEACTGSEYFLDELNLELDVRLNSLEERDQEIRSKYDSIFNLPIRDSVLLNNISSQMRIVDSLNQLELISIIDSIGYPGISKVNAEHMDVAFLIFQHGPLKLRLKYQDLLLNAVSKGEATKKWIPYMVDRNLVEQDEEQIYGTQLFWNEKTHNYEPFKIKDRINVDILRSDFRLGSLADYIKKVNATDDNK